MKKQITDTDILKMDIIGTIQMLETAISNKGYYTELEINKMLKNSVEQLEAQRDALIPQYNQLTRDRNKLQKWDNISNNTPVEITTTNNKTITGIMVKGEFRTKIGSYAYVRTSNIGSYTFNEISDINQVNN